MKLEAGHLEDDWLKVLLCELKLHVLKLLDGKDFAEAVLSKLWLSAAAVAEAEATKLDSCTACSCFEAAEPETVYVQDVLEALVAQKLLKAEGALRSLSAKDF